ncbi:YqcI/YcgG family protein [Crossiella sp. SN42]|uniref:guanitoxin biosynthesis heme-dependent pre-guanitoxin N-hydroxylase GntA n=1 Tax=Crossiella sp. SN42 TaxID=2944808 RepID=UPI00207CDBB5|nr:guanitoxin biosynthesis heme-dependent pre-guanitoxin N-hydroxylase GntA [Crossiella sp. SN42]MCO1579903.1 YqcI/YcgG family protein [Crossiella sp. SN42]
MPPRTADPVALAYQAVVDHISAEDFACLGARAALRKNAITHHHYGDFGDVSEIAALHHDLVTYAKETKFSNKSFASFLATFDELECPSEQHFERLLWGQLQALHDYDVTQGTRWYRLYSSDPGSSDFAYCVGGHPFFVIGMHPNASRPGRRFPRPAVVFNSHVQFNALREKFFTMRERIREREMEFHGSVNPSFLAYEDESRHYGGRFTEPDWVCPFTPRVTGKTAGSVSLPKKLPPQE